MSFCPACYRIPVLDIQYRDVYVECPCGYQKAMSLRSYLSLVKDCNKKSNNKGIFDEVREQLEIAEDNLETYFKPMTEGFIEKLRAKIIRAENGFKKSYELNKNIIELIKVLLGNYNGSQVMLNNIKENSSFRTMREYFDNDESTLKHIEEYYILFSKKRKDYSIQFENCITDHNDSINKMIQLKDGRIATCSNDKTIKIFNPYSDFQCELTFKEHKDKVLSLCQLTNGHIASCSADNEMKIWSINWKEYTCLYSISNAIKNNMVSFLDVSDNRMIACYCKYIDVWKGAPPYTDIPIKKINYFKNSAIVSVMYYREIDKLIIGDTENRLTIWSIDSAQCISIFTDIEGNNEIYQIDNEHIIYSTYDEFNYVNVVKGIIEERRKIDDRFYRYLKCRNSLNLICTTDYEIYLYQINLKKETFLMKAHIDQITGLLKINSECFISCSRDGTIKVWKFNSPNIL